MNKKYDFVFVCSKKDIYLHHNKVKNEVMTSITTNSLIISLINILLWGQVRK